MNRLLYAIVAIGLATSTFGAGAKAQIRAKQSVQPASSSALGLLEQTSEAFSQVAETAMPATVSIKTQMNQPQAEVLNPFEMFGDEFFRRFFGGQSPFNQQQPNLNQQQPKAIGGGSGFIVGADGYIVTNNHVIQDAVSISVTLNDGREFNATVVGSDPRTDLAVLKIEATDLPCLKFGDSNKLKVGSWVIAIGNPFGLEATLTVGVVSAKGRQDLGVASHEDFIQTDAAINPGNSGGPLLNLQGEVVGVNAALFTRTGGYMGVSFSIPSEIAKNVVGQICESGTVKRAFLGIVMQPLDKELADAMGIEKAEGIVISEVIKGSPAAKAGLMQGDVILQLNNKPVKTLNKFSTEIGLMSPGAEVQLKLLRSNKPLEISVPLGLQSEMEVLAADFMQKIGIETENLSPEMAAKLGVSSDASGVVITKVKPNSPAAMAGLRSPFLIIGIAVDWENQKRIQNTDDLQTALKEIGDKKHLILIVRHQNFQRYYTIKLP